MTDKQRIKILRDRVNVLEALYVCYRYGHHPSEALFEKLTKTKMEMDRL